MKQEDGGDTMSTTLKMVAFQLPQELYNSLLKRSQENQRSLSGEIRNILVKAIKSESSDES